MADDHSQPAFGAALSTADRASDAAAEAADVAMSALGSRRPDLAFAFYSPQFLDHAEEIGRQILRATGARHLLGCPGESIVGVEREVEEGPALSLWVAALPGTNITTMHLEFAKTPEGAAIVGWPHDLPEEWPAGAALLALGDPFSFPADYLLERLNEDRPGVPVLGGMASGAHRPGLNGLLCNDRVHRVGAVAALIHGGVRVQSVVSQGCRPVGETMIITKAERNVILELGGKPSLVRLQEMFDEMPPADQALIARGLHVGLVANEYRGDFGRGDFLVRNVMGADRENGAIVVGDYVRVGQTVQFHVRDAASADEDLRELTSRAAGGGKAPAAALLFTCNGRGTRLFEEPHHDATVVADRLGRIPLAGFFAQGEIGPIGGKNFVHGFTASLALFSAE